ncbi:MAG: ABC transporter ATP-binding protein [Chloroflexi bacterium]|nr:ABC transporter ATP-binding protein [Chloroflexota bacterium]
MSATVNPLIEARGVTKVFGGGMFDKNHTVALEDFSFAIAASPPTVTAVVGESGSGKTTLARLLLGLVTPNAGQVLYEGKEISKLAGGERRKFLRDVQMIFQDPYEVYNPFYRVDHVLETPISEFKLANSKQAKRALIQESLRAVGLRPDETLGRYPHQLSGGQRQRIMVARAVLIRPRIIIADEPVSMVDASLRATILDSLSGLNRDYGISIIYITHDLTTAYQISDNIIVLYRGSVAEAGSVELAVKDPCHPYTQLLVGSIPQPDPDHQWQDLESTGVVADPVAANGTELNGKGAVPTAASDAAAATQPTRANPTAGHLRVGCTFADRCPHVMTVCREETPPLFRIDPLRAASCFLYRDRGPAMRSEDLEQVMLASAPTTPSP